MNIGSSVVRGGNQGRVEEISKNGISIQKKILVRDSTLEDVVEIQITLTHVKNVSKSVQATQAQI